jgi:hypothetical protein
MRVAVGIRYFVAAGALAVAAWPAGVTAELPDPGHTTVTVGPTVTGPVVSQGVVGYEDSGIAAAATSSQTASSIAGHGVYYSGSGYTFVPAPAPLPPDITTQGLIIKPTYAYPCPSGETGYFVYGPTGTPTGTICVPNATPGGAAPGAPLASLVQQASSQQPWPRLLVDVNPVNGLVGLPSWFWLGGGSADMPQASASAGPLTVQVRATLVDITWDYGDGSGYDSGTSLGRPYPQQSDVSYVYQSDSYGLPGGYTVLVALRYDVAYSVNGGPWTAFGTKATTFSRQYVVEQAQPEGVGTR